MSPASTEKILVLCQSYYKSSLIEKLLPWEKLGYKLLIGLNSYYGISTIRRIDPRVLIIVDYVPGPVIKELAESFRDGAGSGGVILIPYENPGESVPDTDAIHIIPWTELTAEKLKQTLERIPHTGKPSERNNTEKESVPGRWPAIARYARNGTHRHAVAVRVVLQREIGQKHLSEAESLLLRMTQGSGEGTFFRESEQRYGIVIGVPPVTLAERFSKLVQMLEELGSELRRLSGGEVMLFLSEVAPVRELAEEYEKLIPLERYIFFYARQRFLSVSYIQRHALNQDKPLDDIYASYVPILQAVFHRDREKLSAILDDIYIRQIKRYKSMNYYRLIRSQLMAVYACICCITAPGTPIAPPPEEEYWSLEDALDVHKSLFLSRIDPDMEKREPGTLTYRAVECIVRIHSEEVFAGMIAEQLGVTGAHLSRVFKKDLGIGITECIRYVRIYSDAADMLKGTMSIRMIAQKHGFSDAKYFTKVFRELMGQSPSQWLRAQNIPEQRRESK